jgi:hypothetical protein
MIIQEKHWFIFFLVAIILGIAAHLYRVDALKVQVQAEKERSAQMYMEADSIFKLYDMELKKCELLLQAAGTSKTTP